VEVALLNSMANIPNRDVVQNLGIRIAGLTTQLEVCMLGFLSAFIISCCKCYAASNYK